MGYLVLTMRLHVANTSALLLVTCSCIDMSRGTQIAHVILDAQPLRITGQAIPPA